MMGFSIEDRGVTWWWCRGVAWWHDYVSSSLDCRLSLRYLDHLSGYCIPSLIRQFVPIYSNVYKGILDSVGLLLNKLDENIFINGRRRQTFHGFDAHIKSFRSLYLEMNLSCGCLLCCYLIRLFNFSPNRSHLSNFFHLNSSWGRSPKLN